ncbi:NAD-dependent epimerase/dehydratase family protein [Thiomicrorhabdus sediminis]|uniref:NAD(P)-dependent oxidoreductase n=1 Tax=Thiomicrorhabdus sediminis TaxID=2580412 RepID=A0A4P9K7N9_9GAMM|nr:NAD(P)-dependent oxidoreductase [Thiomicrorhabdus sediminis]QCU90941.1 NAD(P)-dependent oxidoreductase [Thiomicrorhabdus sediminis]
MKKVLVIGASGFVGSHALQAIAADNSIEVIAACRNPQRLPPGFTGKISAGDINDKAYLHSLFDGVDTVCNAFAWTSLYGHAPESEQLFLSPTLHMIDLAVKAGVTRFINVSTTSAAAPDRSNDAMNDGIRRDFWPHLNNVIRIENYLREKATGSFTVINLRLGLFAGQRYALGLLPILIPRLKTHLVPWVAHGQTSMPITDGRDIGQAFYRAVVTEGISGYESFNITGPEIPTVREVIEYLHSKGHPKPHFNVSFSMAYLFGWLMEKLNPIVPWQPLVTRSIIHLLEEVNVDNHKATDILGYQPQHHWQEAIDVQLSEMQHKQQANMSMAKPIN